MYHELIDSPSPPPKSCKTKWMKCLGWGKETNCGLDTRVDEILSKLDERQITLKVKKAIYQHDISEELMEAKKQIRNGYPEVARVHIRLANKYRESLQQYTNQYANTTQIIETLKRACENMHDAITLRDVNTALGEIRHNTLDVESILDTLRQETDHVQDVSQLLAEPDPLYSQLEIEEELQQLRESVHVDNLPEIPKQTPRVKIPLNE